MVKFDLKVQIYTILSLFTFTLVLNSNINPRFVHQSKCKDHLWLAFNGSIYLNLCVCVVVGGGGGGHFQCIYYLVPYTYLGSWGYFGI